MVSRRLAIALAIRLLSSRVHSTILAHSFVTVNTLLTVALGRLELPHLAVLVPKTSVSAIPPQSRSTGGT